MVLYSALYMLWSPPWWDPVITSATFEDHGWTTIVTFFGSCAAFTSIMIHFYFDNKSMKTIKKNLPSLSIIVSTKEGLETFLKFLVTELSVENLGILCIFYMLYIHQIRCNIYVCSHYLVT